MHCHRKQCLYELARAGRTGSASVAAVGYGDTLHISGEPVMSELFIQEAVSLIPQAVTQLGRIRTIVHAAKVVIEALSVLVVGAPKTESPVPLTASARLMSFGSNNVQVPNNSILVVRVGSDQYPSTDGKSLEFYEGRIQKLMDEGGYKSKVYCTNHTVDFQVLCHEKVTTTAVDGDMSVTTTATAQPK